MADAYSRALDEIYESFLAKRDAVAGRLDRDVRDPHAIVGLARELGLCPPPDRVVKVTGSKGKGTTSRLIAHYLRHVVPTDQPVALFVSPEEYEHTDRMTVDGIEVDRSDFIAMFEALRPRLAELERQLPDDRYISPFGVFLLIALAWFRAHNAAWFVLETGRGALHDEAGVLPSRLSVVTSILAEHLAQLGPTLCDVAREKLGVRDSSQATILSAQARTQAEHCGFDDAGAVAEDETLPLRAGLPRWHALDDRLARQAVSRLTGAEDGRLLRIDVDQVSTSWGALSFGGATLIYEALIHLDSLDTNWFDAHVRGRRALLLCSLPDDKDHGRIAAFLQSVDGAAYREIELTGQRGRLLYERRESVERNVAARIAFDDRSGFIAALEAQIEDVRPEIVYCCGTQTYVRLVKAALVARAPQARN